MDQQAGPPGRPKRPPTPASWKPGQSGNVKGRPRKGNALTESIQAGADPDELRDIALDLARNGKTEATKLGALNWLRDSGYTRPAEKHEVGPPGSTDAEDEDLDGLSIEQLLELRELDRRRDEILAADRVLLSSSGLQPAAEDQDRE
jgi:hypothetical protein